MTANEEFEVVTAKLDTKSYPKLDTEELVIGSVRVESLKIGILLMAPLFCAATEFVRYFSC